METTLSRGRRERSSGVALRSEKERLQVRQYTMRMRLPLPDQPRKYTFCAPRLPASAHSIFWQQKSSIPRISTVAPQIPSPRRAPWLRAFPSLLYPPACSRAPPPGARLPILAAHFWRSPGPPSFLRGAGLAAAAGGGRGLHLGPADRGGELGAAG